VLAAARAAAPADRAAEAARLAEEQAQAKEWRMRAEAAAAASAAQRQSEAAAVAEANRQRILEQYAASGNGGVEDWELWGDPREVHHTHVCACSCACHRCCRTISVCMGISVHATPGQYHK
jgi:hypothetical protein